MKYNMAPRFAPTSAAIREGQQTYATVRLAEAVERVATALEKMAGIESEREEGTANMGTETDSGDFSPEERS